MSRAKFSQSEWQRVKDAPYWVYAALEAAEGRSAVLTRRREAKALEEAIAGYSANNSLVRDIIADDSDPAKELSGASESDAEKALSAIAGLVEEKLGADDLDALNDFLLHVGQTVAGAAGEGILGMGKKVSKKEAAALETISNALRATSAHKTERRVAQQQQQKEEWQARQEAEAKEREAARARSEAAANQKAKAEAEARAKADAEAKAKADAEAKAREEAERKAKMREEQREQLAENAREAARKRQEEAREQAEKEAAEAEAAQWIAEHEVVPGDNLSMISEKYYGSQVHWGKIYEANKEVIGANPSLIRPGQRLRIPKI